MKIQIRRSVFETNSSSVHSCSITTKDNYDNWIANKYWYKENDDQYDWKKKGPGEYVPKEEAIEYNAKYLENEVLSKFEIGLDVCEKIVDKYRSTGNFDEAFDSVDLSNLYYDEIRYEYLDPADIFMSMEDYFDYREYEDWHKEFTVPGCDTTMMAWGIVGSDR